jgi:thioesterase domain-containing protein/acyl carrier protein
VVPAPGAALEPEALRAALAARLPGYLVPSAIGLLERLPLSANGKVDRAALPDLAGAPAAAPGRPPAGPQERRVARLYAELLGVEAVAADADFFRLGGTSLAAVQLTARLREATGLEVPLQTLFGAPTVAELADWLVSSESGRTGPPPASVLVPFRETGSEPPLYCVHAVGGNVLTYVELARHLPADQPVIGIQSVGVSEAAAPLTTIEEMAARYTADVRASRPTGAIRLLGWSMGALLAHRMAALLVDAGRRVDLLVMLDPPAPLGKHRRLRDADLRSLFLRDQSGARVDVAPADLAGVGGWERFLAEAVALGLGSLGDRALRRLFDVFAANTLALEEAAAVPYAGPARLILARQEADPTDVVAAWRPLVADLDTVVLPGTHDDLLAMPNLATVVAMVRSTDAVAVASAAGSPVADRSTVRARP